LTAYVSRFERSITNIFPIDFSLPSVSVS